MWLHGYEALNVYAGRKAVADAITRTARAGGGTTRPRTERNPNSAPFIYFGFVKLRNGMGCLPVVW